MVEKLWTKVTIWSYFPITFNAGFPDTAKTEYYIELTVDNPQDGESVEIMKGDTKEELIPYLEPIAKTLGLEIDLDIPNPMYNQDSD